MRNIEQKNKTYSREKKLHLFFFLLPCLALAQYPKAMDFSKLYQGKLDSVVVILQAGQKKLPGLKLLKKNVLLRNENSSLYPKGSDCLKYCRMKQFIKKNILC